MNKIYSNSDFKEDFSKTLGCKVGYDLYDIYRKMTIQDGISLSEAVRRSIIQGAKVWVNLKKTEITYENEPSKQDFYRPTTTKIPAFTSCYNLKPFSIKEFLEEAKVNNNNIQNHIQTAIRTVYVLFVLFSTKRK
jgi:hypothetical protein